MRAIYVVSNGKCPVAAGVEAANVLAAHFEQRVCRLCVGEVAAEEGGALPTELLGEEHIEDFTERTDAAMLVFTLSAAPSCHEIQVWLKFARGLRIPYLFVKEGEAMSFAHVDVPVTFLEEEKEKAPFAGAFGRRFGATINLITAADYGHHAQRNTDAIAAVLESLSVAYDREVGDKDSFGVEKEVVSKIAERGSDLVLLSASREYGLDDILFYPKECHLIKKSSVPVLLINPRGDLYALCD